MVNITTEKYLDKIKTLQVTDCSLPNIHSQYFWEWINKLEEEDIEPVIPSMGYVLGYKELDYNHPLN